MNLIKVSPLVFLILGCAAQTRINGVAEIIPLEKATGEVRYLNPHEVKASTDDQDSAVISKGGRIEYELAEYILSGNISDPIAVEAHVYGGEKKIATKCSNTSSFTPQGNSGSTSSYSSKQAGLKRIEIACDILEAVSSEFRFIVSVENSEKVFLVKTNIATN